MLLPNTCLISTLIVFRKSSRNVMPVSGVQSPPETSEYALPTGAAAQTATVARKTAKRVARESMASGGNRVGGRSGVRHKGGRGRGWLGCEYGYTRATRSIVQGRASRQGGRALQRLTGWPAALLAGLSVL